MSTTSFPILITPAPRIAARDDSILWGYYLTGTSTQTLTCGTNEIFTTSSHYGGCYGTSYLASYSFLRDGCSQASTLPSTQGPVLVCRSPSSSCVIQTIYQTFPFSGSLIDYFCGNGDPWSALTIYRDFPTTSSSSSSSSSTSPTSTTISTSSVPSTSISSATALQPTSTTAQSQSSSTPSNAWIAGPVLGSLALVAFIGFALWYIRNRRRDRRPWHNSRDNPQDNEMKPVPQELSGVGVSPPQEAPTGYNKRFLHELS